MKELEKILFENQSHVVVVGRTGSGKSHTIAKLIELLMKNGKVFILMDYAGEYRIPGVSQRQPFFSYPLLRDSLPEVISEIIRLQSSTAGTWTYDALHRATATSNTFQQLLDNLKQDSEFPVRDAGARAALVRLGMLQKYFIDTELKDFIQHFILRNLQITERKMAITLLLVQLYNQIITGQFIIPHGGLYLIIEEGLNVPEDLLKQLLTQLRGYGVKVILTTQEFRDWFSGYNLIIHDLGNESPYKYGFPRNNLKVGEVLIYNVEKHKWKKVKIKPPKIVKVLPKSQNNGNTHEQEEDETQSTNTENRTQSREEVGSETQVYSEEESTNNDNTKEEHAEEIGETDKTTTEEEDANTDVVPYIRREAETKVLAEEIKEIRYTLSALEARVNEVSKNRGEDIAERIQDIYIALSEIKQRYREMEERIQGLEKYITQSVASINEKIDMIREEMISEINQKVDSIFNNNTKDEEYEDLIETEKRIIQSRLANAANLLIISKEYDKIIVRPKYLGDKFREINLQLQRLGYRLDRDKEHGWYWWKSIYSVKSNA